MLQSPKDLSQIQRVIVASIYILILVFLFKALAGDLSKILWEPNDDPSIWFYSGALLIILGVYIAEPFFSKPTDVIANSVAVLVALLALNDKQKLYGYTFTLFLTIGLLVISIFSMVLRDNRNRFASKTGTFFYTISVNLGHNKVIFSIVYLQAAISYFTSADKIGMLVMILAFWICVTFFDIVAIAVAQVSKLLGILSGSGIEKLGEAIGCENPLLYKVEIDFSKHSQKQVRKGDLVVIETREGTGSIGVIIHIKYLLNKHWLSIYLLKTKELSSIRIDLHNKSTLANQRSIYTGGNSAYLITEEQLEPEIQDAVKSNLLFRQIDRFVGYIEKDSNVNVINFAILDEADSVTKIKEGTILTTTIYGEEVMYQVINGSTRKEHLEKFDSYGFTVGIARKLGKYNQTARELDTVKWMPDIYSPVFHGGFSDVPKDQLRQLASRAIGRLPETGIEIPLTDINSIVTHNTAILGILGIGKSCLAFELIRKIADQGIKVVCVDITNQYYTGEGLFKYIDQVKIGYDLKKEVQQELKDSKNANLREGNPAASGNVQKYIEVLDADLKEFLESTDLSVKIYNPDYHAVSKGVAFKNTTLEDLTLAEKTRQISERLFRYAMNQGQSEKAKYLLVFEEAHSLIPEFNSVASDGDKHASNGTAKVILQGRKFGLGSLVITQRTANISKSILNQCNTVFALRVFDDTGKAFLENYIGSDYADVLPTLEERHAVAIGKGLKLKQPVILQLNDREHFFPLP